jgi:hypothetical protein
VFPLDEMLREEREKLQATIFRIPLAVSDVNALVRMDLWHEGHIAALRCAQSFSKTSTTPHADHGKTSLAVIVLREAWLHVRPVCAAFSCS